MAIATGAELIVHMRHGNWWNEIRRGAPLTVTKGGETEIEFREKFDIMRTQNLRATVAPAKGGRVKITLIGDRFGRALTCDVKP